MITIKGHKLEYFEHIMSNEKYRLIVSNRIAEKRSQHRQKENLVARQSPLIVWTELNFTTYSRR